ncbi:zinc-ribbon domain-containing protein [Streptomyces sp. NPDC056835]|uniref:zinc-ribbon domain-containing protein n=1 Tax=Streptomyces sp. NPDC056835 TaxID=3345956 RepID=UPI0036BB86C9
MIIFGTKGYLYQLAILTLVCGQCGNPSAHTLRKRVTKFTLFFVPLFPFSTKFATQCTFCGAERQVTKEQADQLMAQGTGQASGQGYGPGNGQGYGPGNAQGGQGYGQGGGQPYGQPPQRNPYQQ